MVVKSKLATRRTSHPGGDDTYMSYDTQWANVSNTPFKRFKRWTHEGGIATPLIVNWPAGISDKGRAEKSRTRRSNSWI